MKLLKTGLVFAVAISTASALLAECVHMPSSGTYRTMDGTIIGGRSSEAFCSGAGPRMPGNTQNVMSWNNGTSLGAQWRMWGMAIDATGAVETGRFFDANGVGWIDYVMNYTGGSFWLSGAGVWGDGLGDFTGAITYYNVGAKVSYVAWQPIGVTANIAFRGVFDACNYCFIDYAVANALLVWRTGYAAPMPSNYPPFLCGANAGELYDICCIIVNIVCDPTGSESSTWGAIKGMYR